MITPETYIKVMRWHEIMEESCQYMIDVEHGRFLLRDGSTGQEYRGFETLEELYALWIGLNGHGN